MPHIDSINTSMRSIGDFDQCRSMRSETSSMHSDSLRSEISSMRDCSVCSMRNQSMRQLDSRINVNTNFANSTIQLLSTLRSHFSVQAISQFIFDFDFIKMASSQSMVNLQADPEIKKQILEKINELMLHDDQPINVPSSEPIDDSDTRVNLLNISLEQIKSLYKAALENPNIGNLKGLNFLRLEKEKIDGLYHDSSKDFNPFHDASTFQLVKPIKDQMEIDVDIPSMFNIDEEKFKGVKTTKGLLKLLFSNSSSFAVNNFEKFEMLDCFKHIVKFPSWRPMG